MVEKAKTRFEEALRAEGKAVPKTIPGLKAAAMEIMKTHEKDFKVNRAAYDEGTKIKSEMTKSADRLLANLTGLKQTPSSGSERAWMSDVANRARILLEQEGIRITNADLQAIMWYPEKELYEKLGGRASEGININYAQAWRELAKKKGLSDEQISAIRTVGRRRSRGRSPAYVGSGN